MAPHDDAVICTYDLAKMGGNTVIDIMRTHPMIIICGILQHNPFRASKRVSCAKFESEGQAVDVPSDNGGLTWACDRNIPPRDQALERCLNDMVSVLALPAMWSGSQPSQIVHTLSTHSWHVCLDFVYAHFEDPAAARNRIMKIAPSTTWMLPDDIHKDGKPMVRRRSTEVAVGLRARISDEDISIVSQRCGLHGEIGVIVAGSGRADFPGQTETLLLSVAAISSGDRPTRARLLMEQTRVASELDGGSRNGPQNLPQLRSAERGSRRAQARRGGSGRE